MRDTVVTDDGGWVLLPAPVFREADAADLLVGEDVVVARGDARTTGVSREYGLVAVADPWWRLDPRGQVLVTRVARREDYDAARVAGAPLPSGEVVPLFRVFVRDDVPQVGDEPYVTA